MITAAENSAGVEAFADDSADPQAQQNVNATYDVGYGRPPKAHRFAKGTSGNPRGRKPNKRINDIRELTDSVLDETVQVRDGNRVRTVSNLEAALSAYRREALSGNPKAARNLFKLAAKAGMISTVPRQSFVKLMEPGGDDGKVIRMFRAEQEALAREHSKRSDHRGGPRNARGVATDNEPQEA